MRLVPYGEAALLVHDEFRQDPTLAFAAPTTVDALRSLLAGRSLEQQKVILERVRVSLSLPDSNVAPSAFFPSNV